MSNAFLTDFNEKFSQLTPENKKKAVKKFYELLEEQTIEAGGTVYVYFFDCFEGDLCDRYLTACEINELLNGIYSPMPERDIIKLAANFEATLYRYEKTPGGDPINETCIYDCFNM